jgi:hypothetical protein
MRTMYGPLNSASGCDATSKARLSMYALNHGDHCSPQGDERVFVCGYYS